MKIKELDYFIMNADNFCHGIDLLKLNLKEALSELSKILLKLDDDNSNLNIKNIGGYTFSLIKGRAPKGYTLTISVSLNNISYPIRHYLEYLESNRKTIKTFGAMTFYATYFRLLEIGLLDKSIEKIFFEDDFYVLKKSAITRLDYKLDFFYKEEALIFNIKDLVDGIRSDTNGVDYFMDSNEYSKHQLLLIAKMDDGKPINYNKKTHYNKGDFQNGWTLGNKRNKSVFLRCYEKLVDTLEKGKARLYDDYFTYKNVYRFEIEFLNKFNKRENGAGYMYGDIFDLEEKVLNYFGLMDTGVSTKIYQYKKNKETNFDKFRRQKEFVGRGYTLFKQGFNPFVALYNILSEKLNSEQFNIMMAEYDDYVYQKTIDISNLTNLSKSDF